MLDDGQRLALRVGDVIVQRGTIHACINETDEWARMVYVMLRELSGRLGVFYALTSPVWCSGRKGEGGRQGA